MKGTALTHENKYPGSSLTDLPPQAKEIPSRRPRSALVMHPPHLAEMLFGGGLENLLPAVVLPHIDIYAAADIIPDADQIELLITGWGAAPISPETLSRLTNLEAIIHAGGNAGQILPVGLTPAGLQLSNTGNANAIPVAEYTLAMILLANKSSFSAAQLYGARQDFIDREFHYPQTGNFGKTVGIIGASRTGQHVLRLLSNHDLNVLVYDPTLTTSQIAELGGTKAELMTLMQLSDIISIHAPEARATAGMIGAAELAAMKRGATLLNTSRGSLIDQDALLDQLESGRINAILDVTTPDVLPPGHAFYTLDNVVLTPHIAGSMGNELRRLGDHVINEISRFSEGLPLEYAEIPPKPSSH